MLLQNELLKLRALEPTDIELLYKWENNPEIWDVSSTLVPFSKYILHQYIESSHQDIYESKQLRLIIELKEKKTTSKPVGAIDLFDFDFYHKRAGIGILIANEKDRNKGYAENALKIVHEYCHSHLDMNQLYCHIDDDNLASLKLFEKAGYEITGRQKKWKKASDRWKEVLFLQYIF
jgi:diamine N-acetyltransferase